MSIWDKTKIKKARELKGLSIVDAAKILEITDVHLSFLENGHRNPSDKLIDKMAKKYEQPTHFFIKKSVLPA